VHTLSNPNTVIAGAKRPGDPIWQPAQKEKWVTRMKRAMTSFWEKKEGCTWVARSRGP
jgi:hypothetical protein